MPPGGWMFALFFAAGAVGLPVGANLMVEAAVEIADQLGVSHAVVGLTIVALGTSLPELATTVVATVQRRTEVAVGTVIGSNIFNILAILGTAAVVSPKPITVPIGFPALDLPVMLGGAALLTLLVWRRRPIGRLIGVFLLVSYGAYLAMRFAGV